MITIDREEANLGACCRYGSHPPSSIAILLSFLNLDYKASQDEHSVRSGALGLLTGLHQLQVHCDLSEQLCM